MAKRWRDLQSSDRIFRRGEFSDVFGVIQPEEVMVLRWEDGVKLGLRVSSCETGQEYVLTESQTCLTWKEALEDLLGALQKGHAHHTKQLAQLHKHIRRTKAALKRASNKLSDSNSKI